MSIGENLHDIYTPYVEQGYVTKTKHPLLSLWLYNYTMHCQMKRAWDKYTLMARGVVVDADGKRLVRNMDKFFNHDEPLGKPLVERAMVEPHYVTEKMDGSLVMATLIHDWETPLVHTRGSFRSPQALDAYEWLRREHGFGWMKKGWTYHFEWISPNNRIVVNYHGREELVLLNALPVEGDLSETRYVVPEWKGAVATRFDTSIDPEFPIDVLRSTIPTSEEGFVVHLMDGSRFKIKGEEYVRRHRLVTGLNEQRVWAALKNGDDPRKELRGVLEEEDFKWLDEVQGELRFKHYLWLKTAYQALEEVKDMDIKDVGAFLKARPYDQSIISMVYLLRRGQEDRAQDIAWKQVKPRGTGRVFSSGLTNQ